MFVKDKIIVTVGLLEGERLMIIYTNMLGIVHCVRFDYTFDSHYPGNLDRVSKECGYK